MSINTVAYFNDLIKVKVLHVHPTSVLFTRKPRTGWVIFHEMEETTKTQCVFGRTVVFKHNA